jgi:glycosyltransferase involved in cell wall biosynthesis
MRVHVVDPSAYTPPYDDALCRALAAAGADVELHTSRFAYGELPAAQGYERIERFYRRSHGERSDARGGPRGRGGLALKLAEHVPDMLRYRHAARRADIVHFQWLTVQPLDVHLLPHGRPLVLTAHDVVPREPRPGQIAAQRRLYERMDAIVVHSEHGRERLVGGLSVDPDRVHVIPHGALAPRPVWPPLLPHELSPPAAGRPIVLFFGLLRPYKGVDVLLRAWEGIDGAELWVVGMPRMDTAPLRAQAPAGVRFVERFVSEAESAALFAHADLVVLPYREIDQSGVAFTALGTGTPLLASAVGGLPELADTGAVRLVPPGDVEALRAALRALIADPRGREAMARRARAAANGAYGWGTIAQRTLELYASLPRH